MAMQDKKASADQQLVSLAEAAEQFGVSVKTLRFWRYQGTGGPKSFKLGRRVMYDRSDVLAWYQAQRATANN